MTRIMIQETDIVKAQRMMRADDAFSLIWDIDQLCREQVKYNDKVSKETAEQLDRIRLLVSDSRLTELWT